MRELLGGVAMFCLAMGLAQMSILFLVGRQEIRRARADPPVPEGGAFIEAVFALVPALDEELVIATTARNLLEQDDGLTVVVVDDGSTDRTGEVAAVDPDRVLVVTRSLPEARLGKGPALNAGLSAIRAEVEARGLDPAAVLIVVMDADGHLSEGAVASVKPLFAPEDVGGAQLGVRMRNRSANRLTLIQDFEFWGGAALSQMGRVRTGTVSLGGNGQFTRLSALDGLGTEPWSASLTEDLDLAVSLAVAGWTLTSTPDAWVSQQAVTKIRPLLHQRARWFQGHMTIASRRLGEVWSAPHLSNLAVLELASYLLTPYLMILPWSVLSQVAIAYLVTDLINGASSLSGVRSTFGRVVVLSAWYVISFLPTIVVGIIYSRRERRMSLPRAVAFCHLLLLWNYVSFFACWRALWRMVRGRTTWEKTARTAEVDPVPPPAEQEIAA